MNAFDTLILVVCGIWFLLLILDLIWPVALKMRADTELSLEEHEYLSNITPLETPFMRHLKDTYEQR